MDRTTAGVQRALCGQRGVKPCWTSLMQAWEVIQHLRSLSCVPRLSLHWCQTWTTTPLQENIPKRRLKRDAAQLSSNALTCNLWFCHPGSIARRHSSSPRSWLIHRHLRVEGRWPNCPLTLPISSHPVLQPQLPAVSPADSEKGHFTLFLGTFHSTRSLL